MITPHNMLLNSDFIVTIMLRCITSAHIAGSAGLHPRSPAACPRQPRVTRGSRGHGQRCCAAPAFAPGPAMLAPPPTKVVGSTSAAQIAADSDGA
jgi:hypothetical protein